MAEFSLANVHLRTKYGDRPMQDKAVKAPREMAEGSTSLRRPAYHAISIMFLQIPVHTGYRSIESYATTQLNSWRFIEAWTERW